MGMKERASAVSNKLPVKKSMCISICRGIQKRYGSGSQPFETRGPLKNLSLGHRPPLKIVS